MICDVSVSVSQGHLQFGIPTQRLLRCSTCKREIECSPDDLMHYMREGWLRCCGEVMTLIIETVHSGAEPWMTRYRVDI